MSVFRANDVKSVNDQDTNKHCTCKANVFTVMCGKSLPTVTQLCSDQCLFIDFLQAQYKLEQTIMKCQISVNCLRHMPIGIINSVMYMDWKERVDIEKTWT